MGTETREKEAETWAEFIKEFLNDGGIIYKQRENNNQTSRGLSLIHISEPTRHTNASRMPSSA